LLKDWRNFLDIHEREVGSKYSDGEIWTWRELRVGQTLNVFGREMRVTAVDPTTRDFFRKQGIDLIPNERLAGEKVERPVLPTPAFNGYGDKFHAGKKITMRLPEWCICWCFIDQVFFFTSLFLFCQCIFSWFFKVPNGNHWYQNNPKKITTKLSVLTVIVFV